MIQNGDMGGDSDTSDVSDASDSSDTSDKSDKSDRSDPSDSSDLPGRTISRPDLRYLKYSLLGKIK